MLKVYRIPEVERFKHGTSQHFILLPSVRRSHRLCLSRWGSQGLKVVAWSRSACHGRRALTAADCLCSFWRRDAFHQHQFRQEKHNRHARVFSHCKYFLSCQLPSLRALARFLPFLPPLPFPSKLSLQTPC